MATVSNKKQKKHVRTFLYVAVCLPVPTTEITRWPQRWVQPCCWTVNISHSQTAAHVTFITIQHRYCPLCPGQGQHRDPHKLTWSHSNYVITAQIYTGGKVQVNNNWTLYQNKTKVEALWGPSHVKTWFSPPLHKDLSLNAANWAEWVLMLEHQCALW